MARITAEHKTYIVQCLACFDSPKAVADGVKQEFGLEISRQAVEAYDPNKRQGKNLAKKWRQLFDETRKTFLEDTSAIAISHKPVRLRTLQRMAIKAEDMGNMALAAQLNEQAAKEMGEAYTNRHRIESPGLNDMAGALRELAGSLPV